MTKKDDERLDELEEHAKEIFDVFMDHAIEDNFTVIDMLDVVSAVCYNVYNTICQEDAVKILSCNDYCSSIIQQNCVKRNNDGSSKDT